MAYCRFSSDNWQSDVYAYEAEEGFVVHVAAYRRQGNIPELPTLGTVPADELVEAHLRQIEALEAAERVPIGGPYDGQTFVESSPLDFGVRIFDILQKGYRIPQSALDVIKAEALQEEVLESEVSDYEY